MSSVRPRWVPFALVVAELLIGGWYASRGAGYLLDDYYTLGNARIHGALGAYGHDLFLSRPGAGLLYALIFGVLGGHPLAGLLLMTAIGAASAVTLYLLMARFVRWELAATTAGLWVLLPNHSSLEYWQSAAPLAMSVLLVLAGGVLIARPRPGRLEWLLAVGFFVAASLTYEAVLPAAALLALLGPHLAGGRLRLRPLVLASAGFAGAGLWILANRTDLKQVNTEFGRLRQALPGHFGWGIVRAGPLASILLALALSGVTVCLARLALPSFRSSTGSGERMVAAGMVVIALGVLPFAAYLYAPLGAGDRFNLVSAIGGALTWVGLGAVLWRWRPLALAGTAALLVLALAARAQRVETWTTAAGDARRIEMAIRDRFARPPLGPIVLGPSPVQRMNVAAYLDQSNVLGMLQYLFGQDVAGGIAYRRADYERFPASLRVDIWALSRLEADTDLSVDHQGVPVTADP